MPSGLLPAAMRSSARFDAVADGVADQVQHRVHHPLDQELVDLGALPPQLEVHALAGLARQVAHDERHAAEDLADRHQADPHDPLAQRRAAGGRSRRRSPGSRAIRPAGCGARRAPASRSRRARLITRSPTMRISSSRRVRSTRTKCDGATPPPVAGSPSIAAAGSGPAATDVRNGLASAPTSTIGSTTMPSARHASSVASSRLAAISNSNATAPSGVTLGTALVISPALDSRWRTVSTRTPRATRSAEGEKVQRHRGLRDCRGARGRARGAGGSRGRMRHRSRPARCARQPRRLRAAPSRRGGRRSPARASARRRTARQHPRR